MLLQTFLLLVSWLHELDAGLFPDGKYVPYVNER
jgi:hypothetical protein